MKNRGLLAILLLLACALIVVFPLMAIADSEFAGADDKAMEMIENISPGYEPFTQNIFAPPGSETETLFFCLQATIGAGVIGFGFGYLIARTKYKKDY